MYLKKFPKESIETESTNKSIETLTQHFNSVVTFYDDAFEYIKSLPSFHIGYSFATERLIDLALRHTAFNKKSILEVGCGLGATMKYLIRKYELIYTGIDINEKQVNFLRNEIMSHYCHKRIVVHALSALQITKNIGNFDIVMSEDSFSHIPDRFKLLKNIHEVLNVNGVLVFSDLVKNKEISEKELSQQQKAWCLWNLESKESYLNLIKESGFEVLECKSNLGNNLLIEHIRKDFETGDIDYKSYLNFLSNEREQLIREWGLFNYSRRIERLKTYEFIEDGKLDYNFYVAIKR